MISVSCLFLFFAVLLFLYLVPEPEELGIKIDEMQAIDPQMTADLARLRPLEEQVINSVDSVSNTISQV